jgi:hypothetical protein
MLKLHTKVLSRFMTSGFSLHYVPAPCRQDSRNTEPRIPEVPKLTRSASHVIIQFAIRELE